MGQPRPLFHLFSSFQTNITNFTTNMYVKKCPSSIRCRDSNSRPLEHEPPPITTRPGLPPRLKLVTWLAKGNHTDLFQHSYSTLKFIFNISSWSSGLEENWRSRGREFESWHWILGTVFSTFICCKFVLFESDEKKEKDDGAGPFIKTFCFECASQID